MHRPYRNLMQSLPFCREEFVWDLLAYRRFFAKRIPNVPEAEIKPRPGVRRIQRFETK
jgi:hypothetical protein